MGRVGRWLYRFPLLATVQIGAALLLALLWRFPRYAMAAPLIAVLGLWTGFTFFCAVFYASNAGPRSRNIGVNECLVGLGSFVGLFATEYFMKKYGDSVLYAVCAVALVLSILLQATAARFRRSHGRVENGKDSTSMGVETSEVVGG